MRILNKVVIILILLAIMILVPLTLIFPEQAEFALRYTADVIKANLEWLQGLSSTAQIAVRLLLALVGLIVFLVGLLLIVLELVRIRRKTVRLKDKSGELMVEGIAGHLTYHLDLLPDVLRAQPVVVSGGKKLGVTIHIETPPDVNVPQKSAEVKETARKVIEDQLGLQTRGEIKVIVRPIDYPKISQIEQKRTTRADRPVTPPQPPVQAIIEEEEKRAEPLSPEKQDIPYLTESYIAPAPAGEDSAPEVDEPERSIWDDVTFVPDTEAQEQEDKGTKPFDAKKPPSESLG